MMIRKSAMAVLALATLGLAACEDRDHDGMANPKICADFKATPSVTAAADPATPVEECTRRWAYSLAGSRDSAEAVADAVVAACAPALSKWNQASLDQTPRKLDISEATQKDVRKIVERWCQLLKRSGGPFLLGEWSIADAFFTPVATRFRTYEIHPSDYGDAGAAGAYAERLLETPEFLEWEQASRAG